MRFDGGYSFGANFRTGGLKIYESITGKSKSFVNANGSYSEIESSNPSTIFSNTGNSLLIAHGFRAGSHEFLTDSSLAEQNVGSANYRLSQSIGYRYRSAKHTDFYFGCSHAINENIHYVGQNFYLSSGLSWLSSTLRSSFGGYYTKNTDSNGDSTNYGITIASQFAY